MPGARYNGPVFLQDGGAGGAHTQYYCPGCPYLREGIWAGGPYNPPPNQPTIVQSPLPRETFDKHKYNASRPDLQGLTFSIAPSQNLWFSPGGFGTEGAGIGVDPRFSRVRIHHIFATDDFKPKINIGPAFEVPAQPTAHQAQQPLQADGRPKLVRWPKVKTFQDYNCVCLKNWSTQLGTCDKGCCQKSAEMPFGWCVTSGICHGAKWKVCASQTEPRVRNE